MRLLIEDCDSFILQRIRKSPDSSGLIKGKVKLTRMLERGCIIKSIALHNLLALLILKTLNLPLREDDH